jgi:ankyrin repeat protein
LNKYHFEIKNKPLLMFLLQQGADINYSALGSPNLLISAAGSGLVGHPQISLPGGDLGWFKELVALGADINAQDRTGRTALLLAYGNQHYEIIDYLLDEGADIHLREKRGTSLIHHVAWMLSSKTLGEKAKYYVVKLLDMGLKFDLNNKFDRKAYQECVNYLPSISLRLGPEHFIQRKE